MNITVVVLVACAGAVGALTRAGISGWLTRPWGTVWVNLIGCVFFGFIYTLAERHTWMTPNGRWILLTGFAGALTTFSTYAFDLVREFQSGNPGLAVGLFLLQNTLGLAGIWAGLTLGSHV